MKTTQEKEFISFSFFQITSFTVKASFFLLKITLICYSMRGGKTIIEGGN